MSISLPSPAVTPDGVSLGLGPTINSPENGPDQSKLRNETEGLILQLTQDLYEMEICAGDVSAGMENAVPTYLAKINAGFVHLQNLSRQMGESVPRQVIEQVDQLRNPHTYTKNTLSRASGENQYALGRVLGIESFRRQLSDAVGAEFPTIPLPERRHQALLDASSEPSSNTHPNHIKTEDTSNPPREQNHVLSNGDAPLA